jgi:predicted TIM-barrel fold metal-dependent hydrolase
MKIDVFNHVLPARYVEACRKKADRPLPFDVQVKKFPALTDVENRFRILDAAGDIRQILSMANPPLEGLFEPKVAVELYRAGNDEMAELVEKHGDRFAGAVASVPMGDVDAAVREIDRAVRELRLCGVQLYTDVNGRPLDDPEFEPVFAKMADADLPILLHPARGPKFADYPTEQESKYEIWRIFGWLYDTAATVSRLVLAGVFDRFPDIKIVTHHLGGIIPYADMRIEEGFSKVAKAAEASGEPLKIEKHPYDYFRMLYADTITVGSVAALRCGLTFFGADRVLFATDMPFDVEGGAKYLRAALKGMEEIDIPAADKKKIYEDNARRLFKL